MLSKVGSRVQRRSLRVASTADREQQPRLECAPDLLRWSDFSTPFPPIAPGGYSKYYQKHLDPGSPSRPSFCPFLSHWPEPSSSPEPPPTSPLFADTSSSSKRLITIIQETPAEPTVPRQKTLSILTTATTATTSTSTSTTHSSLRRRRRRLLRTPSVERDFALRPRTLFSVDISVSTSGCSATSTSTPSLSHGSMTTHASSSDCHSSQFDSNHSSDSNHSAYHRSEPESPITPATSVDSEGFDMLLGVEIDFDGDGDYDKLRDSLVLSVKRSDSRTSFNTARSEFSDLEEP